MGVQFSGNEGAGAAYASGGTARHAHPARSLLHAFFATFKGICLLAIAKKFELPPEAYTAPSPSLPKQLRINGSGQRLDSRTTRKESIAKIFAASLRFSTFFLVTSVNPTRHPELVEGRAHISNVALCVLRVRQHRMSYTISAPASQPVEGPRISGYAATRRHWLTPSGARRIGCGGSRVFRWGGSGFFAIGRRPYSF